MEGHIKLFRQFIDWEWYLDINTKILFLHMLLKANWKDGSYKGYKVPRGSFISSYPKLAAEIGISEEKVRTALSHLKKTGEVTVTSQSKFSVFTVENFNKYQDFTGCVPQDYQSHPSQNPVTSQSRPSQLQTIEEKKESNKLNNNINNICSPEPEPETGMDEKPKGKEPAVRKADVDQHFENLWKLYPWKRGKGKVSDANKRRLLDIGLEEMSRAIDRYKADLAKDAAWRGPQNGSTFFVSGFVDYLDSNYTAKPESNAKAASKNAFHNFNQRETDYDTMILNDILMAEE